MYKVTAKEIYKMASESRESIWQQARSVGKEPQIFLHWTAGHYNQYYLNDYHLSIAKDGTIYAESDLDEVLAHTWRRNTGSVGIAITGCYGAGTGSLGNEPPTSAQIDAMAQAICAVAEGLWLTIDKKHVLTHGEAANDEDGNYSFHQPYSWWNDSYGDGDTRGDLEYLGTSESPKYNPHTTDGSRGGDVLRGKALWYKNQNILGK